MASATTVLDYIASMRDAYLLDSVPLYANSLRTSARNPRKVYAYDHGIAHLLSLSRTPDMGRLLENYAYIQLRRRYAARHIYYFQRQQAECDFVCADVANRPVEAIQVCYQLNDENFARELKGLRVAMSELGLGQGTIVTLDESDRIAVDEGTVALVPAWQWQQNAT